MQIKEKKHTHTYNLSVCLSLSLPLSLSLSIYIYIYASIIKYSLVGWEFVIQGLHLCRGMRPPLQQVSLICH